MSEHHQNTSTITPSLGDPLRRKQTFSLPHGCWDNPPWEKAVIRILFVRLSPLEDLEESNTHLFLFSFMRSVLGEKAYGDFCFFPSYKERQVLEKTGQVWLKGLASGKGWDAFDYLLCSCSYALELLNLPLMLRKSGIPLRASTRKKEEVAASSSHQYPLIILGGSNILASQGLMYPEGDSFVDAFYFGEAEAYGEAFFRILYEQKGKGGSVILTALEAIPAIWVSLPWKAEDPQTPAHWEESTAPRQPFYRSVQYARCQVKDAPFLPTAYPLFNHHGADTGRLQISWGCPSFCTFCFEGWERKPYREVPLTTLREHAYQLIANTGASTVELYSFNFNAHGELFPLLYELHQVFDRVNMMSQRVDILAEIPGMLEYELIGEKRSFTLGIEGISQRMRDYYAKGLSETQIKKLIRELYSRGVRELKLFFIISGHEEEQDFTEFQALGEYIQMLHEESTKRERGGRPRVIFSTGFLVRMPWTPLAFEPCLFDRDHLEGLARRMGKIISAMGFEFRIAMNWDEYVLDQLLVAGNHQVAYFLEESSRRGLLYDKGIRGSWEDLAKQYLTYQEILGQPGGFEEHIRPFLAPPYGDLLLSVLPEARYRAYEASQRALQNSSLPKNPKEELRSLSLVYPFACFRLKGETSSCRGCNACRGDEERHFITEHRFQGSLSEYGNLLERLIKKKRKSRPRYLAVYLPKEWSSSQPEYIGAVLLRAVFQHAPHLIGRLFRIEEAFWSRRPWQERLGVPCVGWTVLGVYGISGTTHQSDPCLAEEDWEHVQEALRCYLGHAVEPLADFSPENYYPDHLELRWEGISAEEELRRIRRWLQALHVAATERKDPEGNRIFEIAPRDKKKRILRHLEFSILREAFSSVSETRISSEKALSPIILHVWGAQKIDLTGLFLSTELASITVTIVSLKKIDLSEGITTASCR